MGPPDTASRVTARLDDAPSGQQVSRISTQSSGEGRGVCQMLSSGTVTAPMSRSVPLRGSNQRACQLPFSTPSSSTSAEPSGRYTSQQSSGTMAQAGCRSRGVSRDTERARSGDGRRRGHGRPRRNVAARAFCAAPGNASACSQVGPICGRAVARNVGEVPAPRQQVDLQHREALYAPVGKVDTPLLGRALPHNGPCCISEEEERLAVGIHQIPPVVAQAEWPGRPVGHLDALHGAAVPSPARGRGVRG